MRTPAGGPLLSTLICLLFAPPGATAQPRSGASAAGTSAEFATGARLTSIRGETTVMVGVRGLLRVRPSFSFGGGAWALTEIIDIDGSEGGGGLGLRVAYGGGQIAFTAWRGARTAVELRALVGAGNAKIELPVVGTEIAADNFLVVEPEAVIQVGLTRWLRAETGFGYRAIAGVEDLPGVGEPQLRGAFATIGLVIG
jgi:hypothetical protein